MVVILKFHYYFEADIGTTYKLMNNNDPAELQEYTVLRVQFPKFSTEPYVDVSYLSLTYSKYIYQCLKMLFASKLLKYRFYTFMTHLNFKNIRNSGCNFPNLVQNPTWTWVTFLWRIWSILLIKSGFKWSIHLVRSLYFY